MVCGHVDIDRRPALIRRVVGLRSQQAVKSIQLRYQVVAPAIRDPPNGEQPSMAARPAGADDAIRLNQTGNTK
jgi:hypothetical protein